MTKMLPLKLIIEVALILANAGKIATPHTLLAAISHDAVEDWEMVWPLEKQIKYLRWIAKLVQRSKGVKAACKVVLKKGSLVKNGEGMINGKK